MSKSIIYTVSGGSLQAMRPSAPESEDIMQELVAQHPEIISDRDGKLLLIRREQPIGDGQAHSRWSLDHLFVTSEGIPVLVELKRAVDTRLRREVVGQMLDYAANATAHWRAGTIADSFEATAVAAGNDPAEVLRDFLGEDRDAEAFWERVDDSFSAGRIKLVFVADTIPDELARIVEFLNEQMKADVRAVELNWFEGDGIKAFTPRIIGETQRAQSAKAAAHSGLPPISVEEWIDTHFETYGSDTILGAHKFVATVIEAGARAVVTQRQGSIVSVIDIPSEKVFPMSLVGGKVNLNLNWLKSKPGFQEDASRQELLDTIAAVASPLTTTKISGQPGFPAYRINDPKVQKAILDVLRKIETTIVHSATGH